MRNIANRCISIILLPFLSFVLGGYVPALGTDKNANDLEIKSLAFLFYEFWRLLLQLFPRFSPLIYFAHTTERNITGRRTQ